MAVAALIQYTQSASPGIAGRAYVGTIAGGVVSVANDNNANITSWTITLLDVPPGSALVPGVLATAANNTPAATFTPDVAGSYRIRLSVTDGTDIDVDIRNFAIPNVRGLIIPSYQKLPDPLPVTGSGLPGEKPDEQNYGGQTRGWAGNRTDGQLEYFFNTYDDLPYQSVTTTPYTAAATLQAPLYYVNVSGAAVFNLPSGIRVGQRFRINTSSVVSVLTVNPPGGHTIEGLSFFQMLALSTMTFVYRGSSTWSLLGSSNYRYERSALAGIGSTDQTSFVSVGAVALNPDEYPNLQYSLWSVILETTNVSDSAEIRLFNLTTASLVASSILTTTSTSPIHVFSPINLASGLNVYEAQLRLTGAGAPDRATCKQAVILLSGVQ